MFDTLIKVVTETRPTIARIHLAAARALSATAPTFRVATAKLMGLLALTPSAVLIRTTAEFLKANATGIAGLLIQDPFMVVCLAVLTTTLAVLLDSKLNPYT